MGMGDNHKPAEVTVDVYSVLNAFGVTDPIMQHIAKKALCTGLRGHKSLAQDLDDIQEAACRAVIINHQREELRKQSVTHIHTIKVNAHIHQPCDNSNSHTLTELAGKVSAAPEMIQSAWETEAGKQPHRPELKGVSDATLERASALYRGLMQEYSVGLTEYNASVRTAIALLMDTDRDSVARSLAEYAVKAQAGLLDGFGRKQLDWDIGWLEVFLGRRALAASLRADLLKS